jgi:hypothetical protein
MPTPMRNSVKMRIGQSAMANVPILCPTLGYNSSVSAKTNPALICGGIAVLPKKGAKSMSPLRRTEIVSSPLMIAIRGIWIIVRTP